MGIDKQRKKISEAKSTSKPKPKIKSKPKSKTFEKYFQECIQSKTIPPDTPSYLKNAFERALKEHEQGIKKEQSALLRWLSEPFFIYP